MLVRHVSVCYNIALTGLLTSQKIRRSLTRYVATPHNAALRRASGVAIPYSTTHRNFEALRLLLAKQSLKNDRDTTFCARTAAVRTTRKASAMPDEAGTD
ncbi:hypothetical protein e1012e08.tmp0041 [Eimeria tenella]|uniref:Uncharacterized protein n=1 Tax=Eimeria tenella TaxID=5802 RepID=C8TDJ9_EIMTE|nr:hypothetical protein e1012e08.tmp0041 [Eimeria tenella]